MKFFICMLIRKNWDTKNITAPIWNDNDLQSTYSFGLPDNRAISAGIRILLCVPNLR